jgi:hypothetical protein
MPLGDTLREVRVWEEAMEGVRRLVEGLKEAESLLRIE